MKLAEQLRKSILKELFTGKLVKPYTDNGEFKNKYLNLLEHRSQLIKNREFQRPRGLKENFDVEADLPEDWVITKLGIIFDVRDGTHDTPKYVERGVPLVTSKNLVNNDICFENVDLISEEDSKNINLRSGVDNGDILFAMIGSIGNPVLVDIDREISIKNVALFKKEYLFEEITSMEYLYYYLYYIQDEWKANASGAVQSFISLTFMRNEIIPLPPIEEQRRIVEKIEEILPLIKELELQENSLLEMDKQLPDRLRKSILQSAMEGKITKQFNLDDSVLNLIEDLNKKEKELIENKLFKRNNRDSSIAESDIPFDIPDNWQWVKMSSVVRLLNPKKESKGKLPYMQASPLRGNSEPKIIEKGIYVKDTIQAILVDGENSGEVFIVEGECYLGGTFRVMKFFDERIVPYMLKVLKYYEDFYIANKKGVAIPHLDMDIFYGSMIPLPPLEEQERIVDKLDQLFAEIDLLESNE